MVVIDKWSLVMNLDFVRFRDLRGDGVSLLGIVALFHRSFGLYVLLHVY